MVDVHDVWETDPQVQPADRDVLDVHLRRVRLDAVEEQVSAGTELLAHAPQVRRSAGLSDDVERCRLQDAADVHGLGGAVREDRSRAGPRTMTAATRRAGETLFVSDRR